MATALTRTEHHVSRADGRVYYYKVGQGPPLIFLHNISESSYIWRKVIDKFAEDYTCHVIDLPGHDHSDTPSRKYFMGDFAKAIIDVMDSAGIEDTDIVGSHGGCVVAMDMAIAFPKRVKKMVFDGLPYWNLERGKILFERFFEPGFTDTTSFDIPVRPLGYWEERAKGNPRMERDFWETMDEVNARGRYYNRLSFEALTSYDVEAAGPKIKQPTLLLYGERDALRRGEQRAKEGIKDVVLTVVPDCGAPHWDKPEEFVKLTLAFLKP